MNHPRPPRCAAVAAIALLTDPQAATAAGPARITNAWSTLRASRRGPDAPRVRTAFGPFPGDAA